MTKMIDDCERIERIEADAWYKAWYSAVSLVIGAISGDSLKSATLRERTDIVVLRVGELRCVFHGGEICSEAAGAFLLPMCGLDKHPSSHA